MPQDKKFFLKNLHGVLERLSSFEFEDKKKEQNRLSTGDRASLRRMNPTKDSLRPPAFWRIVCEFDDIRNQPLPREKEMKLAAVLQGMALTADDCLSLDSQKEMIPSFGAALASLDKKDARSAGSDNDSGGVVARRLDQLLRSSGERFLDLLRYTLRYAASQNLGFSWKSLAELCLTDSDDRRRYLYSQLTKDFYRAQWNLGRNNENENKGEELK